VYGKYKYELSKRQSKSKSAGQELKEIRLGRSIKIDKHDVQIRVDQARRFLIAGHKVSITQRFRGREIMHKQLGEERLFNICTDLSDVSKVEMPPRGAGRAISVVLAPDKPKIESYVTKQAAEGKRIEEEDLAKLEAEVAAQNAKLDAQERHEDEQDEKKEKRKGPRDDRASNPVDDEIADLLGG
ncbi:MAG: translation initiation factor IF-3, partial [Phycisphaerales bacterium]|nr:translation initiation factor IF-3 [Phycisphaerales bacterium]